MNGDNESVSKTLPESKFQRPLLSEVVAAAIFICCSQQVHELESPRSCVNQSFHFRSGGVRHPPVSGSYQEQPTTCISQTGPVNFQTPISCFKQVDRPTLRFIEGNFTMPTGISFLKFVGTVSLGLLTVRQVHQMSKHLDAHANKSNSGRLIYPLDTIVTIASYSTECKTCRVYPPSN